MPHKPPAASRRLLDHRWIATAEANRAQRRRVPLLWEDALAAAMVGLWTADTKYPADMPRPDFERAAHFRCRRAIIDQLREIRHGSRMGGTDGATKPWRPEPGGIEAAQALGRLPKTVVWVGGPDLVSSDPTPEEAMLEAERAAVLPLIEQLPQRMQHILRRRFAGELARDTARALGISQARVSQIYARALGLLDQMVDPELKA